MPTVPPDSSRFFDDDWGALDEGEKTPSSREPRPPSARFPPSPGPARGRMPTPPPPRDPELTRPMLDDEHRRETLPPPVPMPELVGQMMLHPDRLSDPAMDRLSDPGQYMAEDLGTQRSSDDMTRPFNRSDIPGFDDVFGPEALREELPPPPSPLSLAAEHELMMHGGPGAMDPQHDPRFYGLDGSELPPPASFPGQVLAVPGALRQARHATPPVRPRMHALLEDPEVEDLGPSIAIDPEPIAFHDELDDLPMDDVVAASQRAVPPTSPPAAKEPRSIPQTWPFEPIRLPTPPPFSSPGAIPVVRPSPAASPAVRVQEAPSKPTPPPREMARSLTPGAQPLGRIKVTPGGTRKPTPPPGTLRGMSLSPESLAAAASPAPRPAPSPSSRPPPSSGPAISFTPEPFTPPPSSPPITPTGLRLGATARAEEARADAPATDAARKMQKRLDMGDFGGAMMIAENALADDPDDAFARSVVEECRGKLTQRYLTRLGSKSHVPRVVMPAEELRWLSLDHRAGFVVSTIDGAMSIEEVLDVACMGELDALRILFELREQGVIDIVAPPSRASRR